MFEDNDSGRGVGRRSSVGSYGNYPWDGRYDHELFLSEMVPVSFHEDGREANANYNRLVPSMFEEGGKLRLDSLKRDERKPVARRDRVWV